jgi:xanthine dehydrogenase YagT iron-sulfur-binding subunit
VYHPSVSTQTKLKYAEVAMSPCSEFLEIDEEGAVVEAPEVAERETHWTRREFLAATGLVSGGLATVGVAVAEPPVVSGSPVEVPLAISINGKMRRLTVDTRTSLLDLLRENLDLTGSKKGCDHGQCGACTVLLDGKRVNSCLTLAVAAQGAEVTTIEGLGTPESLSAVQSSFLEHDGYQCGYCTPGQICSATALIDEFKRGELSQVSFTEGTKGVTDQEIKERMSGNICRCGAYPNIVAAVRAVTGGVA